MPNFGFLAQMMGMGMGAGRSGGGSMMGGTTDRPNARIGGDPRGNAADPRLVEKTSGRDPKTFPTEFRQALQGYYNSIAEKAP